MIIGLLLVLLFSRMHFKLAEKYDKEPWLYAIISGFIYIMASVAGYYLIKYIVTAMDFRWFYEIPFYDSFITGMPIGIFAAWAFRSLCKSEWSNENEADEDVLDDTL